MVVELCHTMPYMDMICEMMSYRAETSTQPTGEKSKDMCEIDQARGGLLLKETRSEL